jgi:hypothetical protein
MVSNFCSKRGLFGGGGGNGSGGGGGGRYNYINIYRMETDINIMHINIKFVCFPELFVKYFIWWENI